MEELSEVQMKKKMGRAFYSGKAPLQPLSFQILDTHIQKQTWLHPFIPISDFFSLSENKAAATQEEILHALNRFAKSALRNAFHLLDGSREECL